MMLVVSVADVCELGGNSTLRDCKLLTYSPYVETLQLGPSSPDGFQPPMNPSMLMEEVVDMPDVSPLIPWWCHETTEKYVRLSGIPVWSLLWEPGVG